MLQFYVARLIVGTSPPLAVDIDPCKVLVGLPAGYRSEVIWIGRKSLCDVVTRKEMGSLIAKIVDLKCGVLEDLSLHGKSPLLHVRILWILRDDHGDELALCRGYRRDGVVGDEDLVRQFWRAGHRLAGGCNGRAHRVRIDVAGVVDLAALGRVEEDSVTPSNHCLVSAERPVSKAESRSKRLLRTVGGIAPPAISVHASRWGNPLGQQRWICNAQSTIRVRLVQPPHLVVLLEGHRAEVPSNAQVHRQAAAHLPVVLHEGSKIGEVVLVQISSLTWQTEWSGQEDTYTLIVAEQKIGNRIASAAGGCGTPVLGTGDETIAATILIDQIAAICDVTKVVCVEIALLYPETIVSPHRQRVLAVYERQ